jgi:hypothetical protein
MPHTMTRHAAPAGAEACTAFPGGISDDILMARHDRRRPIFGMGAWSLRPPMRRRRESSLSDQRPIHSTQACPAHSKWECQRAWRPSKLFVTMARDEAGESGHAPAPW